MSLHHEVLLALSGYPGNVFAASRETGLFEVRAVAEVAQVVEQH